MERGRQFYSLFPGAKYPGYASVLSGMVCLGILVILHCLLFSFVKGCWGPSGREPRYILAKIPSFSYFFIFSSAALAAAKPHSLIIRFTYRSARVPGTVTFYVKHLPALQAASVHPSGRLPSCTEMPDGSLKTGIEALEKRR
ncbi:hypothetical protein HELRODRAFT_158731 [Helobdella robusta]|uniref:Uncharacterized protein n=1 Tax=Helobdella robusta TaxID=6412 RepID=T1EN60_HELRO|nr:hypothetical protein HELRODRAFT_158731 [Helobdella robusta]ESO12253.1 hypothetical protein HELRODRAFT_158731 [Helobdella robusta]